MSQKVEFSIVGKDKFSNTMKSVRGSLNAIVKTIGAIGVVSAAGLGLASKELIKVGRTTENLKLRMSSLLGSVGEGNKVFKDMADFAAQVPFSYEGIMESATQLSGVLKGGSDEIKATMPIIADLAAVSGLSIQQTTDQVARMFSAGAGAADLFREKGITAMLGFQSGVAVSAEETKKKLIAAFEDPASRFRGAAEKMATTWDGILSMIGDKWFNIKSEIADAGLFNFFKAIATVINDGVGKALDNTRKNAESWSNSIIDGIKAVMDAVGFLADMFRGLAVVWKGLVAVFSNVAKFMVQELKEITDGVVTLINKIPGIDIEPLDQMRIALSAINNTTRDLNKEFTDLLMKEMPSAKVQEFKSQVESVFEKLQEMSLEANSQIANASNEVVTKVKTGIEELSLLTDEFMKSRGTAFQEIMGEMFNVSMSIAQGVGDAFASAIIDGKDLGKALQSVMKQAAKDIIAMLIRIGIQRLILGGIVSAATAAQSAAAMSAETGRTYASTFASIAAIPIIGPGLAPGVAATSTAAMLGGAVASAATGASVGLGLAGAAHGGLDFVPRESTFLLDKGERVLSPNQNTDLTNFLSEGSGPGGTTIENFTMTINTSASSFDDITEEEVEEFVADRIIPALDTLSASGVRQADLERSNV